MQGYTTGRAIRGMAVAVMVLAMFLLSASSARADHTVAPVTIPIIRAWGGSAPTIELTYAVQAGEGVPANFLQQVYDSIALWNAALDARSAGQGWAIRLVPFVGHAPDSANIDIHIARGGGPVRGFNLCKDDRATGMPSSCRITIAGQLMSAVDLDDIRTTAWHEVGHALGLGHANQPEDPMCTGARCHDNVPNDGSAGTVNTIHCDVDGVVAAHHWLTTRHGIDGVYLPARVGIVSVTCPGRPGPGG